MGDLNKIIKEIMGHTSLAQNFLRSHFGKILEILTQYRRNHETGDVYEYIYSNIILPTDWNDEDSKTFNKLLKVIINAKQ